MRGGAWGGGRRRREGRRDGRREGDETETSGARWWVKRSPKAGGSDRHAPDRDRRSRPARGSQWRKVGGGVPIDQHQDPLYILAPKTLSNVAPRDDRPVTRHPTNYSDVLTARACEPKPLLDTPLLQSVSARILYEGTEISKDVARQWQKRGNAPRTNLSAPRLQSQTNGKSAPNPSEKKIPGSTYPLELLRRWHTLR